MRKKVAILMCMLFPAILFALDENEIDWRYGKYGVRVVTNAPSRHELIDATNALEQSIIGFVYSPSNLPPVQTTADTVIGPQSNDIARAANAVITVNGSSLSVTSNPSFSIATGTDAVARAAAAYAYSPTNKPTPAAIGAATTGDVATVEIALTNEAALRIAGDAAGSNNVYIVRTNLQSQIDGLASTQSVAQVAAAAAYAYSPTNLPPALTNILMGVMWTNNAWYFKLITP